jgi:hypothetical protein
MRVEITREHDGRINGVRGWSSRYYFHACMWWGRIPPYARWQIRFYDRAKRALIFQRTGIAR